MAKGTRQTILWLLGVGVVVGMIQATPYYGGEYSQAPSFLAFISLYLILLMLTLPIIAEKTEF